MPLPEQVDVHLNHNKILLSLKIILRLQNLCKQNLRESDPITLTVETLADTLCDAIEDGEINE